MENNTNDDVTPTGENGKELISDRNGSMKPQDFTPWLAKDLSELGEALSVETRSCKSEEASVKGYSIDVLAHDDANTAKERW